MDGDGNEVTRVVLLCDRSWPQLPGVCCWRHAVHEAFALAGARVDDVAVTPRAQPRPLGRTSPRLKRLPPTVRQPLGRAYRGCRRVARRTAVVWPRRRAPKWTSQLNGAALVIAESLGVAVAAVQAGAPRHRVWALAFPPDRLQLGDTSDYARELANAAQTLGGFLTDSELARESIERATSATRQRVALFPPLAVGRPCPSCSAFTGTGERDDALPSEVAQLVLWRALLEEPATDRLAEPPFSFPAARLRGLSASRTATVRVDWTQHAAASPWQALEGVARSDWSAHAQARTARLMLEAVPPHRPVSGRASRSVLVSGFDLKFVRELAARLDARTDLNVTLDEWPGVARRTRQTKALATHADSILAEWARPSAAWLSRRKRPGQFLVVRLHRFELDAGYPPDIVIENVDAVVHVSPPIGRRIHDELGWPKEKLVYIPNFLDMDWLDRPKLPEARFGIGFVGMEFANKRFDLALDVLSEVRRHDLRFTLFVRSVMPWDNRYAWSRPEERVFVGWCFERIEQDPLLRGAVIFEPPGRDMARWYRRVGHVLSMSDIESFHLAPAEGMASGAVPVVRLWPGAEEIYDKEWIHDSVQDAAAAVLASADATAWADRAARAKTEISRTANPAAVVQAWADLLGGDVASARSHFAEYASR